MAMLRTADGQVVNLLPHHLVGRSRAMHTRIDAPDVSAQHGALIWNGEHWLVRDLGSRNGTFVNGMRVAPAESVALAPGAELWFGDPRHAFTLTDTSPPQPAATAEAGTLHGESGYLALPSEDDPMVLVRHEDGGWLLSRGEETTPVKDGDEVEVAGTRWTLVLPDAIPGTLEASRPAQEQPPARLAFRVSRDEEYVELSAVVAGEVHRLRPRTSHYPLLLLARARLEDRRSGCPEPEEGWLHTGELARALRVDRNQLYLMLHRSRKDLGALGLAAEAVIEKRVTTQQIRLGVPDVLVESL